jgi:O-antigen ligase
MPSRTARSLGNGLTAVGLCALVACGSVWLGNATNSADGALALWLVLLTITTFFAYRFIMRSAVYDVSVGHLYAVPALVTIVVLSFFSDGIAGVLSHQMAWGILGIVFVFTLLLKRTTTMQVPLWLAAYAGLGFALLLLEGVSGSPVLDVGLSALGLFVTWQVAVALRAAGGIAKLLTVVAFGYWLVTGAALLVYLTHIPLGSMTPDTVTMPWDIGFKSIFTNGNYGGYGFISTQAGREASFVVCAFHLVRWRFDREWSHGVLALLAFALFVTGYGRVPLVGAVVGFAVILFTDAYGTRVSRILISAVLVVAAIGVFGLSSGITSVSGRTGAPTVGASTGHLSLWSQHLGLFLEQPLTGVGSNATAKQIESAQNREIFHDANPLPAEILREKGSRGEGGWTGLLAQRGVICGGICLALLALALAYCFSAFPGTSLARQDMILARSLIPASLIFYITDVAPFSVYTVTAYVLAQVTMIAAVRTICAHRERMKTSNSEVHGLPKLRAAEPAFGPSWSESATG